MDSLRPHQTHEASFSEDAVYDLGAVSHLLGHLDRPEGGHEFGVLADILAGEYESGYQKTGVDLESSLKTAAETDGAVHDALVAAQALAMRMHQRRLAQGIGAINAFMGIRPGSVRLQYQDQAIELNRIAFGDSGDLTLICGELELAVEDIEEAGCVAAKLSLREQECLVDFGNPLEDYELSAFGSK